jgi:hypothetical protein
MLKLLLTKITHFLLIGVILFGSVLTINKPITTQAQLVNCLLKPDDPTCKKPSTPTTTGTTANPNCLTNPNDPTCKTTGNTKPNPNDPDAKLADQVKDSKKVIESTKPPTLQYQVDPAIGGLSKCNAAKAPDSPAGASAFIADCIKNIMELVVGISVILAIMSLVFLGIRSLNSFDSQASINQELSERIKGFTVGAVILGLFSALIGTLNPAALNFGEIFGVETVQSIRAQVDKTKSPFDFSGGDDLGLTPAKSGTTGAGGATGTAGGAKGAGGAGTVIDIANLEKDLKDSTKAKTLSEGLTKCLSIALPVGVSVPSTCDQYSKVPAPLFDKLKTATGFKDPTFPTSISAGQVSPQNWKNIRIDSKGTGSATIEIKKPGSTTNYKASFNISPNDCKDEKLFKPIAISLEYKTGSEPLISNSSKCKINKLQISKIK